MKKFLVFGIVFSLAFLCKPARAAVVDSSAYGFTIKYEINLTAVPDSVYKKFIAVANWWDEAHTFSGKSSNLILQDKANGCFCEKLTQGGSVRHMTVIYADPGKMFRMSGGMGPLQAYAVNGIMTFMFRKTETGTALSMTYTVGGYIASGILRFAPMVDQVMVHQMDRLKAYVEK
jgi:hypothetical protein